MNAIISGRAEIALLEQNGTLFRLPWGEQQPLECSPAPLSFFFGDASDLQFVSNLTIDETRQKLEHAVNCEDALHLALIAIDGEVSDELRIEASDTLEELTFAEEVRCYVRGVFFARPLTADSDIEGALRIARAAEAKPVFDFWHEVRRYQPIIQKVWLAWEALDASLFQSIEARDQLRASLVRAGQFTSLVEACHAGVEKVGLFVVEATASPEFKSYARVPLAWTESFRSATFGRYPLLPDNDGDWAHFDEQTGKESIHVVFTRVQKQKTAIVEAMQVDLARARRYIVDLVADQMRRGGQLEFVVKSLCDLAMEAKSLGLSELQLELTTESVKLKSDDAWAWIQHGDTLRAMGRSEEALTAYEEARIHGQVLIARTGCAEVLKSLGRLDEALAAYEQIVNDFPNDAFARNGRAEVLKSLGRLDKALAAYEQTMADFPNADSLNDVVSRTGRAGVLKSLGRLDEALAAYEQIVSDSPNDAFARNGRAGILLALGRLDEALASLPHAEPKEENDWIAYHIRGMILLKMKKTNEAVRVLRRGATDCPIASSRSYFSTALAVARLRQRDFVKAVEVLRAVRSPEWEFPANVLMIHAHGELERREQAQKSYDEVMFLKSTRPALGFNDLLDELHHRYLNGHTSQHDDEWIFNQEFSMLATI